MTDPFALHLLLAAAPGDWAERLEVVLRGLMPADSEGVRPGHFLRVRDVEELGEALIPPIPRLVLATFDLPGAEGLAVVRKIRAGLPGSPVIVFHDAPELAAQALELGVAAELPFAGATAEQLRPLLEFGQRTLLVSRLLARERDYLSNLLENTPELIYFKDRASRFLRIGRATCRHYGLRDPSEAIGKTDFDFFTEEHAKSAYADEQEMLRTGAPVISKIERESFPDGRTGWVLTTKMPMRDRNGQVVGTFGISRDVTALHEMEQALSRERNLLRNLIDNIPDQIFVKDIEGRYILDNVAHLRRLGLQHTESVVGKTVYDFFPAELAAKYSSDDHQIAASGKSLGNYEERIPIGATGEERWHLTTKIPLIDEEGIVTGLVCISRDIHEQKVAQTRLSEANEELSRRQEKILEGIAELQESNRQLKAAQLQLIQAEKMESVGRLAAGIAHEVKNPLATIRMGIEYLRRIESPDADLATILSEMDRAVSRADRVIRELLDYSAAQDLERSPVPIDEVIHGALGLVRGQIQQAGVDVKIEIDPDLPVPRLDRMKIEQVLVNLIMNATQAMTAAGSDRELSILCCKGLLENAAPTRDAGDRSGMSTRGARSAIVIEVQDSGPGIPEEKMGRIFDPFFTTKPTGIGTGLGLTVSSKIMELHGGTIRMKNRTDRSGAIARVILPLDQH